MDTRLDIRVDCAWCGEVIREGATTKDGYISHGICPTCKAILLGEEVKIERRT